MTACKQQVHGLSTRKCAGKAKSILASKATYVRLMWTILVIAVLQSVAILPAVARSPCAHVGPTRDVLCVCSRSYCWLEPGTRFRFEARFDNARALTNSGARGLGRQFGQRGTIVPAILASVRIRT